MGASVFGAGLPMLASLDRLPLRTACSIRSLVRQRLHVTLHVSTAVAPVMHTLQKKKQGLSHVSKQYAESTDQDQN